MTALNAAILFNNSTGSDTQSSGSSAGANVYGSGASTTSASAVVTGITTTGVQAGDLLWVQSSSGRQFSVIASVDSGTQVTCDDTFANTESSRTWAIGGKRATLAGSSELYDRSGSDGDAKAGHIIELEDGYTETLSSTINLRVANSGSQGFTIRGALNSTTKPVLTFTNNGTGFHAYKSFQLIQNIELKNSSATKTACRAVNVSSYVQQTTLDLLDIHDATDYWLDGFHCYASGTTGAAISRCSIGNCSGVGIHLRLCANFISVEKCKIFNCTNSAIVQEYGNPIAITNSLFYGNGSRGINLASHGGSLIVGNIFHSNGTDSIKFRSQNKSNFSNNIISSTTNGINCTSFETGAGTTFDSNAFYNCTNNTVNIEAATNSITLTADPFVDAANGDFNLNADAGGGATLRANNFSINTDTSVYPFRQYVSDDFGAGGGGAVLHPLRSN